MRAIVQTRYGSPEVLQIQEKEKPIPGPDEVLVKVVATTVNRTDCAFRQAAPWFLRLLSGLFRPRQQTLGSEFSGVIEAVGQAVTLFRPGDAVFGLSTQHFGAHAEYLCIAESKTIAAKPESMSYAEAAAICEGPWYAWTYLKAVNISSEHSILIYGASGSIGSSAVQLAKAFQAKVTAVCATKNLQLVQSLGASVVIDYTKTNVTSTDQVYDFVFDAVGKLSYFQCRHLLKPKGVYFSTELGWMWQNPWLALFTPWIGKRNVIFPIPKDCKENLLFFKELVDKGQLHAVIDRTYAFDQIAEAYRYADTGQKTGSLVIQM